MKRTTAGLAAAGLLVAMTGSAAPATDRDLPPYRSSANVEMVAHIPFQGGTDLEFFSRTLTTYRDATGAVITPPAPVERHFSLVGSRSSAARIVDITDPVNPYVVSQLKNCTLDQGDVQVNKAGTLAAVARQYAGTCRTEGGKTYSNGSAIVDLNDVYNPRVVGFAVESAGSHNHTLHPGGRYLYISTNATTPDPLPGTTARIPIFDLIDPANPKLVNTFKPPGAGPHDIRFSPDGKRAYTASNPSLILNTEDPVNPSLISVVTPPNPAGHDSLVTPDGAFLFRGHEAGGGGTFPCPGGAIYAYDIRDEQAPTLIGVAEAGGGPVTDRMVDEPGPGEVSTRACTSHVMELNPGHKSLSVGWYSLGSRMFDFSFFYNADGTPKPYGAISASWGKYGAGLVETGWIAPNGARTWSAKQYAKVPGYLFSDDEVHGFYVSRIKP